MTRDRSPDQVAVAAGALAPIIAGLVLVPVRGFIHNANIALAMGVVVVAVGALGGRRPGAFAAITAALSFNFFYTQPYLSLRIASADDVETMALLLLIGVIAGQVAAVARRRRAGVQSGKEELDRVWRVTEQAVSGAAPDDLIAAVRAELVALLRLHDCWWDVRRDPSTLPVLQSAGVVERTRVHRLIGGEFELPPGGFDIPVRADGTIIGYFRCIPIAGVGVALDRRRTAVVLTDALGLALRAPNSVDRGPSATGRL